jgi:polyvinyl alcohol dehydrogenase (cytochrome)
MTILLLATFAPAQSPEAGRVFERNCVTCHGNPAVEKAPDPSVLRQMSPEAVYKALTSGAMVPQAEKLTDAQKRMIAEYLGGRNLVEGSGDAAQMPCGQKTRRGPSPPEQSRFLFLINVSVSAAFN